MELHLDYLKRYGFRVWSFRAACGLAHLVIGFRALRGMTLAPEEVDPAFLAEHPPFSHHRCRAAEFADLPDAEKLASEEFYESAIRRGDWCHYIADGDTVASYGWYSNSAVPAVDDTWLQFSPEYVYMYKGFTAPEYRGKQLHGHGMAHAATEARHQGYRGLISYVEAQNESSLRSVARLGYRTFGTCYRLRVFGRTLTFSSPGCRRYGFGLSVSPDSAVRGSNSPSAAAADLVK